ncbi:MAG: inositol monophosphatase family protein, partial [Schleiferiaceae bacterium]
MSWDEHTRQGTLDLVLQVGAWIQNERRHFETGQVETKSLNSLVSYVDRHAEDSLIQGLQTLVPESGFLGEEGGSQSWVDGGLNWIIDPLDGTTNFIH